MNHYVVEEHLHVTVGGGGVVPPQPGSPLDGEDDPGHAPTGRAAIGVDARVVVALTHAGIPGVALDAGLAGIAAVPPQAFLQDVVADGRAEVFADVAVLRQQLVKRVERVGGDVWVERQRLQPLFVG